MPLEETTEIRRSRRGLVIDAIGWALFITWLGVVMLFPAIPRGLGALVLGLIVLLVSAVRLLARASVSIFWIVIGGVFLAAGIGEMAGIDLPLLPSALIVCGVLLFVHSRAKRRVRR